MFNYDEAFARNIGLMTIEQQERLRTARVAFAGCGGGGGGYIAALARAGVGRFSLADPDEFNWVNHNRQYGASAGTIGRNKAAVMGEIVAGINPDADVRVLPAAIDESTVGEFLEGVDVVLDGIDFFAPAARRLVYREARSRGIPVVVGAPLGWSAAWPIWMPEGPSLEEFCGFTAEMATDEVLIRNIVATAPGGTHLAYMRPTSVDFSNHEAPSLGPVVAMLHGIVASEVLNLLTGVRPVKAVPHYFQFDVRTHRFHRGYLRWGNANPIQRIKIWYVRRLLERGIRERAAAVTVAP